MRKNTKKELELEIEKLRSELADVKRERDDWRAAALRGPPGVTYDRVIVLQPQPCVMPSPYIPPFTITCSTDGDGVSRLHA